MGPPSYRSIQPAPGRAARSGASSGTSGSGWLSAKGGLTKRIKAVTQACHTCRRNKAKCDGVRPRCGGCRTRAVQCRYEGEAGQSRQAALRTRLGVLENLVSDLRSKSTEDAERLLQRLRSVDDVVSLGTSTESDGWETTRGGASSASSQSSFPSRSPEAFPRPAAQFRGTSVGASSSSSSAGPHSPRTPQGVKDEDMACLLRLEPPNAEMTWTAVQSFFTSCGTLFHIYTREQLQEYHRAVFGNDGKADTSQKLAICCLCAVAAVGIQYNAGFFQDGLGESFHEVSRHFFSEVMEERPLDTIKVCTLFAMFNILNKATVALAYVEVGLTMSKRQSLNTGVCHPSMVSTEEWIDFRRTWRALLFFASWLSSTLGYISGEDDASEFEMLLPVAEQDHDSYSAELGELVQAEITKISLLQAGILRNHLAVPELTTLGLDGIIRELQEWHGQLPESIKLRSLYRQDWTPLVRWSIYHLHLFYCGAFMLVYRRIAAHCVRLQRTGGGLNSASREANLLSLVEQGVTSARDTARIVSLLLEEQGVFRRCWIVIFQTHTACVVILHCVAQKQLHRFPPSSWAEDMKRAQQCIDVLGYCGNVDPVALRFRVRLSAIYDSLQPPVTTEQQPAEGWVPPPPPPPDNQPQTQTQPEEPTPVEPHPITYLFTTPPSPDPRLLTISFFLLFALCRPWSDTAMLTNPNPNPPTATDTTTDTTMAATATDGSESGSGGGVVNDAQFLQQLEWDFGKVTPFRWDTDGMGMLKNGEAVVGQSCFLDSEGPSGWTVVEDLSMGGDLLEEEEGDDEMEGR
ncbi:hypothetical protein C8A00DRAFT_35335 [Chaetomidium leptoderma]|uniref:Zn(2)-C6 fungal-type domain-containing protein n=1 Tax=Chaetomidium leptoderma TaxID=669021 RepID=A0AAN6ZVV4_9PEZI|nr:hypothetical protein C8A00DRAFT_35335 [Chaetomidium leptoderma]